MKRFLSFVRTSLLILAIVTVSVAFEGCSEVADKTIDEIKDIPAQMFATRETAETAQVDAEMISPESAVTEYNYIYYRHNNQWVTSRLVSYEVADNGQNIKFEVDSTMSADRYYYTSMANVMLIHRDEPSAQTNKRSQCEKAHFEIQAHPGGTVNMTATNIVGFILIAISIVVQVGSFVVRWFCIPSEPYFSEKTNCMVTYAEIKDMRHRCNVVTVIGVVLMAVGIVLAIANTHKK